MSSFGLEVARRLAWGAVRHGALRMWHFGPACVWWMDGQISEEMEALWLTCGKLANLAQENEKALETARKTMQRLRARQMTPFVVVDTGENAA